MAQRRKQRGQSELPHLVRARWYQRQHPWLFREHLSAAHPDFELLESHFRNEEAFRKAKRVSPTRVYHDLLDQGDDEAANLINGPDFDGEDSDSETPAVPRELVEARDHLVADREGWKAVPIVLKRYGLRSLRRPRFTWGVAPEEVALEEEIQKLMWDRITAWYGIARGPRGARRLKAQKALKQIGSVLAGDARGRRRTLPLLPMDVLEVYHKLLYRLIRAILVLSDPGLSVPRRDRVRCVADICGLAEAGLREYLRLDENNEPTARPLEPESQARLWVARLLNVTEESVRNILSGVSKKSR